MEYHTFRINRAGLIPGAAEAEQIQENMEELIQALQVLGYRRYEINNILPKIKEETLEDRIKEALKYLAR